MYTEFMKSFSGADFFRGLISQMEAEKQKRIKDEIGITVIGRYEGIERLKIPHKYDTIGVGSKYFTCCAGSQTTIYNSEGKFILEADKVLYLKKGMFLAGNAVWKKVDKKGPVPDHADYAYALYEEEKQLTDFVFKPYGMTQHFNEFGFMIVGMFGDSWKKAVINKSGDIVFELDSILDSPYLNGVICSIKKKYINLLTGNVICEGGYDTIHTDDFIFSKTEQNCVYQISKKNGDYIIHGTPKPPPEPKPAPEPVVKKKIESGPKRRRNEPCHCGSGKKFKNCCI